MFKFCQFGETPAFLGCFSKRPRHIFGCHMSKTTISLVDSGWQWISEGLNGVIFLLKFVIPKIGALLHLNAIFVLILLCFRVCLFIDALWSPAWKGLNSWLSFVMSNCEVVTFQLVSWVRRGLDCIDS